MPEDENYSGIVHRAAGPDRLGERVRRRAVHRPFVARTAPGASHFNETAHTENTQAALTAGIDWNFAGDWQLELSGSYADNDLEQVTNSVAWRGVPEQFRDRFQVRHQVGPAQGGRYVVHVAWRQCARRRSAPNIAAKRTRTRPRTSEPVSVTFASTSDQNVRSAFGEMYVPVVGKDNAMAGVQASGAVLAGRYEDYSTAGSSFDPQYGLMWEPVERLAAARAPRHFVQGAESGRIQFDSELASTRLRCRCPAGRRQVLQVLRHRCRQSAAAGVRELFVRLGDRRRESMQGLSVALNYYRIRYIDLVATPATAIAGDARAIRPPMASSYSRSQRRPGESVHRDGADWAAASLCVPRPDVPPNSRRPWSTSSSTLRRRNLSVVEAEGWIWLRSTSSRWAKARSSSGINGTYILDQEQQITDTSPAVETVGYHLQSAELARARPRSVGSWQGWATNLFVNHTDSYVDNRLRLARADCRCLHDCRYARGL